MRIANTKSGLAHVLEQIERLDKNEIDVFQANAYAKLHSAVQGYLNYELKRALTIRVVSPEKAENHIREIESKNFDALPR